tara:strand:- start:759 stop:1691 length:933 start_codon:yes stop_codon:yes gene_type:complete
MDKIEHLVIPGAGAGGLIEFGIIKELISSEKFNVNNIKSIHSTSIGCWVALFVTLKYEIGIINDFLVKRPWNKLFNITPDNIMGIFSKKGIFGKEVIVESLSSLFEAKSISATITMRELFELTNIKLFFYSTNVNKMKCEEFSCERTPEIPVIDAIYMSCAVPMLFKPFYYNNCFYMDGGIYNNYPLDSCVEKNIQNNDDEDINSILNKIFGICFSFNTIENITSTLDETCDFVKYFNFMIRGLIFSISNDNNVKYKIKYQIDIPIDKEKLNSAQINDISFMPEKRMELINKGTELCKEFIKNIEDNENQ